MRLGLGDRRRHAEWERHHLARHASVPNGATQAYAGDGSGASRRDTVNIVASASSALDSDPGAQQWVAARGTRRHDRAGAGDVVTSKTGPATVMAAAQLATPSRHVTWARAVAAAEQL